MGGSEGYGGHMEDQRRLHNQSEPNTRANGYVTNQFAGGGVHKTAAKVKGKGEHRAEEAEYGNDYGV